MNRFKVGEKVKWTTSAGVVKRSKVRECDGLSYVLESNDRVPAYRLKKAF